MDWSSFILKLLDHDLRYSSLEVENLTGIRQQVIDRWKKGKVDKPQRNTIRRLEEGLKIKIDDSDPDNITYRKIEEKSIPYDGVIPVQAFPILATVYAGEPAMLEHQNYDETAQFAYNKPGHRCFALKVSGNSMETTLRDGDVVLIDMDVPLVDSCLVAVKLQNGHQYIKRYYDINYAFIKLTSDNSEYGVKLVDKNDIIACYRVVSINFAV